MMKEVNEFLRRFVELIKIMRYVIILIMLLVIVWLIPYLAK